MDDLSYVCGTSDKPLLFKTIGQAIEDAARAWPNHDALIASHQNIRWTYKELLDQVDAFAAGLIHLGLKAGDRVGVWSPNNAEWVVAQLATARAGLIQVNINPAYRLRELQYALNLVECRALIMAEAFKSSDYVAMLGELAPDLANAAPGTLASPALRALQSMITISTFDPIRVLEDVEKEKCTALYAVPTMFIAMLETPEFAQFDLSSLRTGVMAGSICPADVMARVIKDMHMHGVTICYGMTETSPVSMQTLADDPVEKRVATVGKIHPFVEVKIVDDTGRVLPRGQQGEFLTRGYSVMRGYWGDDEKTKASIDATGWMHTGDLAVMDRDGYVDITGRLKDMIIRGGENIYPREIEEYLYTHPQIRDVQVFGVPDEKFGEEVCAWIQLRDKSAAQSVDIAAFCKGQIAHFKIPRHIRFVEEYPMTVTGKVQKFEMRNEMIAALASD